MPAAMSAPAVAAAVAPPRGAQALRQRQRQRRRPALASSQAPVAEEKATPSSAAVVPGLVAVRYCDDVGTTRRRNTRTVWIGDVGVGSEHPIRLQTMTTTDTKDVAATVMRIADAGAEICRITVQGKKEALACFDIKNTLVNKGYNIPLVADIHFAPSVALMVAECFDKIRVNPGNYADPRAKFDIKTFTEESYQRELDHIRDVFGQLVEKCKKYNRAIRIGTNHGSLSDRIMSYYGDSPRGMVESALEFARVARELDFHNFLFSMKASNPVVMVQAYRALSAEMYKLGWDYPLHLGVTEAGEGEDGRMKSAIGIGALLQDGLGDTIRVSLTEAPEAEIDPCRRLAGLGTRLAQEGAGGNTPRFAETFRTPLEFNRRSGDLPVQRESDGKFDYRGVLHRDGSVIMPVSLAQLAAPERFYRDLGCKTAVGMPFKDIGTVDSILMRELPAIDDAEARKTISRLQTMPSGMGVLAPLNELLAKPFPGAIAVVTLEQARSKSHQQLPAGTRIAVTLQGDEDEELFSELDAVDPILILVETGPGISRVHASRRIFQILGTRGVTAPVLHHMNFAAGTIGDELVITAGSEAGALLVDGLGDGVLLEAEGSSLEYLRNTAFGMLQGCRMRNTKTEFVSCPSCGRTLFDLQEVTASIRDKTGHLPGVAIAIMGCIVNGPGEMADADFGYVGGNPGKIDLYVGKSVVKRGIDMDKATDALIDLIKEHGRWVEPEIEEPIAA
eukprot:jgi/Chlat1/7579/Chrsp63S07087